MQWKLWVIWKLYVQLECTWKFHIAHMRLILKLFEYIHIFYVLFSIKIKYLNPIKLFQEEFKYAHQRIQKLNTFWLRKCIHCVWSERFPGDFVLRIMTNGVKWDFDIIKHYNLRAIRVDTITFKDALSHNDLNGLVLDEIYILRHINHTTMKKKTNDRELNQEILFLMGSKHDQKYYSNDNPRRFFITKRFLHC